MAIRSTQVDPRRFTLNQEHAPARLVDSITAAMYEAFLRAGARALAVVADSMVVVLMAAVGVVDRTHRRVEIIKNSKMESNTMLQSFSIFGGRKRKSARLVSAVFALSLACFSAPMFAQEPGQRTFTSAEDAGREFFAAMQSLDEQAALRILGPAGKDIL